MKLNCSGRCEMCGESKETAIFSLDIDDHQAFGKPLDIRIALHLCEKCGDRLNKLPYGASVSCVRQTCYE